MAYTLLQLRQELAKSVGSYITPTISAYTTTTITCSDIISHYADDYFNGGDLQVQFSGDVFRITDYVGATGVFTMAAASIPALSVGSKVFIYWRFLVDELNNALRLAVKDWRFDESLSLSSNQARYTLSSSHLQTADQIIGVYQRTTASDDYNVPVKSYHVFDNAGTLTLELTEPFDDSMVIKIVYRAAYSQMLTGSAFDDATAMGGDLWSHILLAQAHLFRLRMIGATPQDRNWWAALYQDAVTRIKDDIKDDRRSAGRAHTVNWLSTRQHRYQPEWWL